MSELGDDRDDVEKMLDDGLDGDETCVGDDTHPTLHKLCVRLGVLYADDDGRVCGNLRHTKLTQDASVVRNIVASIVVADWC